ncbi:GDP-mannose 4,6-dehydratase [Paenibacillus crassostreae]|uniref:UDP-glucose 4-epimerase n=1 Tax=Paenibacillus crassostreae TaxID=1763538 RepID=A0A167FZH9_9BACL|nr:GDP-mannose 4,6-dehydratase [Paenibacillus crassostreae]AOZ93914.1 UDP-glucose 4-epimerase [Paenibacillus crassostreae]OAB77053.1 UDP-glucose 4-epimerase [Paenibacillus crassostreae]
MKAIVTGGAGFIGSHLVDHLLSIGFDVHIIDNLYSGHLSYVHPQAIFHQEDIRSQESKEIIVREKPDVVFHMAAQADVQRSINDPCFDADVNITGTVNLLNACQAASVKRVIFSSTSAVYGDLQNSLITEKDPAIPISYYGLSKWTAEAYIRIFSMLHGMPFTILRYGNVYGPRQMPKGEGGVISVFIQRIKEGLPLQIQGDGEQTRDFVFVKDVVKANIAAIKYGTQETIHISTGRSITINNLVHMLKQIHGSDINTTYTMAREGDIRHSCLDCSKANRELQWQSEVDMINGLIETYHFK